MNECAWNQFCNASLLNDSLFFCLVMKSEATCHIYFNTFSFIVVALNLYFHFLKLNWLRDFINFYCLSALQVFSLCS